MIATLEKNGQVLNIIKPDGKNAANLGELLSYVEENRLLVNELLLRTGAVLFRGFDINDRDEFLKVKEAYAGNARFDYIDGNSPRTKLTTGVYTSTEYPKEFRISLHSEMSYSNKWPDILFFFCKTPAKSGGETPIADCRHILKMLNPGLVDKFSKHGVKYTRYLNGTRGLGKTWMDTFETDDKGVIEKYCRENNIEHSWDGNSLILSQLGTGIAIHPVTQEKVWFNQANQFHPSGLPEDVYKGLMLLYAKNRYKFPQNAFYGNDEEISEEDLKEITEVHFDCAIKFKWEKGDLLIVDNMLMAHGRMPFEGERKILVSMC